MDKNETENVKENTSISNEESASNVSIDESEDTRIVKPIFTQPPRILKKEDERGIGFIGIPIIDHEVTGDDERKPILAKDEKALLDLTNSEVFVILGKRGSGKSYTSRVIIEEIIKQNTNVAAVILDKMGVYFSLKYQNTNDDEISGFEDVVKPMGFKNHVRVFIPACDARKVVKGTYDYLISLRPNQIPFDAWCQIFEWNLMDTQARCMKTAINRVIDAGIDNYGIDDLINTISGFQKYKDSTKDAVISKLEFAEDLGLFNNEGIALSDIVAPNITSVIDVSQSGDKIATLLTAFFSEALYQERKRTDSILKHKEMGEIKDDINEEDIIPPTFLVLEEFHTYMPRHRGKAVSSEGLIKYIKEGRGIGLSFIGISQQPELLNTTVLTQLGVLFLHNLTTKREIDSAIEILPCPANVKKLKIDLKMLTTGQCFYCLKGPYEPRLIKTRPAHSIHLARSENTQIFNEITDKKLIKRTFSIFGGGYAALGKQQVSDMVSSRLKSASKMIHSLNEKLRKLSDENFVLKERIDELNANIAALKKENDELYEKYVVEDELHDLVSDDGSVDTRNSDISENIDSKYTELLADHEKLLNEVIELRNENKRLGDLATKTLDELREAKRIIDELELERKRSLRSNSDDSELITELKNKINEIKHGTKMEISRYETLIDNLERKNAELQHKVSSLLSIQTNGNVTDERVESLITENKKLQLRINGLQKIINTNEKELGLTRKLKKKLKELKNERNELKKRLSTIGNGKNAKKGITDELNDDIKEVLEFMRRHVNEPISVQDIVNTLIMNPIIVERALEYLHEKKILLRKGKYFKLKSVKP